MNPFRKESNLMINKTLLTEKQAADYLQLTPRCLQAWRYRGEGPRFTKISGRCIRYVRSDIDQWIEARKHQSTSENSHD